MTSPGGRIEIRVDPDMRGFTTRLTSGLASAAGSGVAAFASAATSAIKVAGAAAAVGLGAGIRQGLKVASFTEQAQISFETLLGSAEKAKTYLAGLQDFASRTPFELPGVVEGAQRLLGVGAAAESVIPTLTAWGDAAGALGLTQDQFGRTLTAVTQMMGKGKVSAEEMLQITEAGIPIWMLLAKATGKPVPELQKLASEGKLLAEDVLPALEAQMNADYGGSMAKQAGTLSGVWSTAKDNINLALKDAVLPLAAGLKTSIPDASAAAATAIRELGVRGSEGLVQLIERGQELRKTYGPEFAQLGELASQKWQLFTDLLSELGSQIAPSLPSLVDSLLRIAQVGAEVGEAMLPALQAGLRLAGPAAEALAGTLGVVANVLESIEPVLPVVVAGFVALKGIGAARDALGGMTGVLTPLSGKLRTLAQDAAFASYSMDGVGGRGAGALSGGLSRAATAATTASKALPFLGLAVAAVGYSMEQGKQLMDGWAQALLDGGHAAEVARKEMRQTADEAKDMVDIQKASGLSLFTTVAPALIATANAADEAGRIASKRARELYTAMSPLQQAQQDVTTATNNLSQAQKDHGVNSQQAEVASRNLATAQAALEQKQRDLDNATRTATSALLAQTQAAIAGANADLAASLANTQLSTALETYNASLADGTLTTVQRQQATDAMTQASLQAAQAAGQQAFAHSTATTEEGKQAEADAALLASLKTTAAQLGSNTPAAISNLITSLEGSASTAATTSAQMRDLGLSVTAIPGSKDVQVNAPTEDQRKRLQDLGYTVTNIPGSKNVIVHAETAGAQAALDSFIYLNSRRSIQVSLNVQRGTTTAIGGGLFAATGGYIRGPGTATSDSIPAWLSNGEYVVRAAMTARSRPGLDAANRGDWAAAAQVFSALANQQSRATLAAAAASRAASTVGRFAAGGYVDAQARADTGGQTQVVPVSVGDVVGAQYNGDVYLVDPEEQARQRRRETRAALAAAGLR